MSKTTGLYPPTSDPNYQKVYKEKNRERLLALWKAKRDLKPRYRFWRKPEEFQESIALYQSGLSVRDCEKRTGINCQTILAEMRRQGIPRRPQKRFGKDNPLFRGGPKPITEAQREYSRNYQKAYHLKHKAKRKQQQQARPLKERQETGRRSYHKNKHKYRVRRTDYGQRRRAWYNGVQSDPVGIKDYMARTKSSPSFTCYYCRRIFSSLDVTFDHVFPFNRKGPHSLWNLCTACGFCNSSKCDYLISEWKTTGQLMLEL